MRRHAKASSAGSTSSGGASLGSIRRGALAGRASSSSADGSGAPSHRLARLVLALVLALAGLFALTAAPAFAIPQVFSTTIGASGSGAGQLSNPRDVAVDQSTGDIYVADTNNRRVVKFDSAGNFILAFGKGVDQTSGGDVCTAASGDTCQAGTAGTGGGAFITPEHVAVDNSGGPSDGDVYVGDIGSLSISSPVNADVVSKFTPAGAHLAGSDIDGSTSNTGQTFGDDSEGGFPTTLGIEGIALDPDGKLWVYANDILFEFGQSGTFIQKWADSFSGNTDPRGIAADRDHVYVVMGSHRLVRFNTSGLYQGTITRGPNNIDSVTLDPDTGELYANRAGAQIEHYNASCAPVVNATYFPQSAGCPAEDVIGSANLTNAVGLAIDTSTSTLYVADAGSDQIKVFVAPPAGPPVISNQWTSSVASTDATVNAAINPMRNDTTCQLSYTDDATFQAQGYTGATTVSCDPADLGSRFADHPAKVDLAGLAPGTTYHYRFLAHSSAGDVSGADRTFSTEIPELNLPDNRAYEQVSPPNKDLGGITTSNYQAASDGNRLAFSTRNSLPGSASDGRQYNSARGPGGWSTTNQIPPQSQGYLFCVLYAGIAGNSADLSQSILTDGYPVSGGFDPSRPCGKDDPELVPGEPDGVQNLFLRDNVSGAYQLLSLNPVTGAPADARFQGADPGFTHIVFREAAQLTADAPAGVNNLYEYSGGAVKLVSVDPGGAALASGGNLGSVLSGAHAVSDDGTKIFFQGGDGNLYARVNGAGTVQLDASQAAGSGGGGQFQFAAADGSKVFFSDDASAGLTADTQPGSGTNLYRYDFASGGLTDLTPGADVRFAGLAGASDDGSRVYFAANGALAPGAASGTDCAPPSFGGNGSTCNLYLSDHGALAFIATLSSDVPNDCVWNGNHCVAVSADGSHLAFNSDQSLGGVDTGGQSEIYLYDRSADQLACASCPATGAQPSSSAQLSTQTSLGPATTSTSVVPHSLNADGSRLFFTAFGPLVARDTNGRQDVYEYSGGRPHLISSGTGIKGASFIDASAGGDDVFFATEQKLTSSDIDDSRDIYDARVGGGFPEPPPPPPPCEGDACRGSGSSPSNLPGAGSAAFNGPGNPQINRKAKKHHKKHHHKRRHHKRTAKHNRRAGR